MCKIQSVIPPHRSGYPVCTPHAIRAILLIQPASPIPEKHVLQYGPCAFCSPSISPNQQRLIYPPPLLCSNSKDDHLVRVKFLRYAAHHLPTAVTIAKLEDLPTCAERLERLDAAYHIFLCDSATAATAAIAATFEATQTGKDADEPGKFDESTVSLAGAHADIHDLHAKFALPIT